MPATSNRQIIFTSRPEGLPSAEHLQVRVSAIPEPKPSQFQIKHLYLGLSPSARLRMSGDSDYGKGLLSGEVVIGQTVGIVTSSRNPDFREGELVVTNGGWQEYSLSSGKTAAKLDPSKMSPLNALGLLGTSGLTAYVGLTRLASPGPGKTLLVSAASGSVGSVVGQIGKNLGCRVVGVTGGADKCAYLIDELGFHDAVDHRDAHFVQALRAACRGGVDIYFENVGGAVLDAAWPLMADFGQIVLCGMIAQYNQGQETSGPSWFPILAKRLSVRGFLLRDHGDRAEEYRAAAEDWIGQGKLRMRYDVTNGIENAPSAFVRMLKGENFGKSLVRVSAD